MLRIYFIDYFSISLDAVYDTVPLYAKLADLGNGIVNTHTFSNYMQIKPSESLTTFFNLFDKVSINISCFKKKNLSRLIYYYYF